MSEPRWVPIAADVVPLRKSHAIQLLKESRLTWRWSPGTRGETLELLLDEDASEPYAILQSLVDLYELVVTTAAAEGIQIRPYKPLEEEVIVVAAEVALRSSNTPLELVGNLIHELVWGQGLPNANHRTTFALIVDILEGQGITPPASTDYQEIAEAFAVRSKPLILDKEFAVDPGPIKDQHRAISMETAQNVIRAAQSRT